MADTDLLIKCLGMSQSAHDGEALAAIRKANRIRENLGMSWEDLLAKKPTGNHYNPNIWGDNNEYKPQPNYQNYQQEPSYEFDHDDEFQFIYDNNTPVGKWAEIIGSIKEQWEENGRLSEKQRNLIKKFYKTAQEKYYKMKNNNPEYYATDEW